jgi:hypothetical protein
MDYIAWMNSIENDSERIREQEEQVSETCSFCANSHINQKLQVFCELKCRIVGAYESCPNYEEN